MMTMIQRFFLRSGSSSRARSDAEASLGSIFREATASIFAQSHPLQLCSSGGPHSKYVFHDGPARHLHIHSHDDGPAPRAHHGEETTTNDAQSPSVLVGAVGHRVYTWVLSRDRASATTALRPGPPDLVGDDRQHQGDEATLRGCWGARARAQYHGASSYGSWARQLPIELTVRWSYKTRLVGGSHLSRLLCSTSPGSSRSDRYETFDEARALARSLGFKSMKDWAEWSRTKERPRVIPADPRVVYGGDAGLWQGWEDFLGCDEALGSVSPKRRWLPFEEAQEFARTLGLSSQKEWNEWINSGEKPPDIPSAPDKFYRDKGWKSWGDFLGFKAGYVVKGYMAFEEARDYVRTLGFTLWKEWREWSNESGKKPPHIPGRPDFIYKDEGWLSWGDFLGFKKGYEVKGHMAFEEARDFVRSLGLKSKKDWEEWRKSGERSFDIPSNPDKTYKTEGWLSWGDFLGYDEGHVATKRKRRSFTEALGYARSLGLKSLKGWREFVKSGKKPSDIPSCPDSFYKGKGWKSWGDFLGFNEGYMPDNWRDFQEAREYARSLGLKSQKEWWEWSNESGERPLDIPSNPNSTYKNKGWKSWGDFMGFNEGYMPDNWRDFQEAREYARSLGLKSRKEWNEWSNEGGERPSDIPSNPNRTYKNKGWKSWGDFLGY